MIGGVDYASIDNDSPPACSVARSAGGVRFVYQRGAFPWQGKMLPDHHMTRDRASWRAAGVTWGSYVIIDYDLDGPGPEEQVDGFIENYGDRQQGELPPALDIEFTKGRAATGFTVEQAIAWIERAWVRLQRRYGIVVSYTSTRVMREDLGDPADFEPSKGPLWLKTPYPYGAGQPPHPEARGPIGPLPRAWSRYGSPGAWLRQYQGDAVRVPGFTATVDLDEFMVFVASEGGNRAAFVIAQLDRLLPRIDEHGDLAPTQPGELGVRIRDFQTYKSVSADAAIGPVTFALLTASS